MDGVVVDIHNVCSFRQRKKILVELRCVRILIAVHWGSASFIAYEEMVAAPDDIGRYALRIHGQSLLEHIALQAPFNQARSCQLLPLFPEFLLKYRQELPH